MSAENSIRIVPIKDGREVFQVNKTCMLLLLLLYKNEIRKNMTKF